MFRAWRWRLIDLDLDWHVSASFVDRQLIGQVAIGIYSLIESSNHGIKTLVSAPSAVQNVAKMQMVDVHPLQGVKLADLTEPRTRYRITDSFFPL
jgi:hypothetical protein